jgi:hypothetical protein
MLPPAMDAWVGSQGVKQSQHFSPSRMLLEVQEAMGSTQNVLFDQTDLVK